MVRKINFIILSFKKRIAIRVAITIAVGWIIFSTIFAIISINISKGLYSLVIIFDLLLLTGVTYLYWIFYKKASVVKNKIWELESSPKHMEPTFKRFIKNSAFYIYLTFFLTIVILMIYSLFIGHFITNTI